jgi:hypothetical protein
MLCVRMRRETSNVANLIYRSKTNLTLSSRFDNYLEPQNYQDRVYHPLNLKAAASLSLSITHKSAKQLSQDFPMYQRLCVGGMLYRSFPFQLDISKSFDKDERYIKGSKGPGPHDLSRVEQCDDYVLGIQLEGE